MNKESPPSFIGLFLLVVLLVQKTMFRHPVFFSEVIGVGPELTRYYRIRTELFIQENPGTLVGQPGIWQVQETGHFQSLESVLIILPSIYCLLFVYCSGLQQWRRTVQPGEYPRKSTV